MLDPNRLSGAGIAGCKSIQRFPMGHGLIRPDQPQGTFGLRNMVSKRATRNPALEATSATRKPAGPPPLTAMAVLLPGPGTWSGTMPPAIVHRCATKPLLRPTITLPSSLTPKQMYGTPFCSIPPVVVHRRLELESKTSVPSPLTANPWLMKMGVCRPAMTPSRWRNASVPPMIEAAVEVASPTMVEPSRLIARAMLVFPPGRKPSPESPLAAVHRKA